MRYIRSSPPEDREAKEFTMNQDPKKSSVADHVFKVLKVFYATEPHLFDERKWLDEVLQMTKYERAPFQGGFTDEEAKLLTKCVKLAAYTDLEQARRVLRFNPDTAIQAFGEILENAGYPAERARRNITLKWVAFIGF